MRRHLLVCAVFALVTSSVWAEDDGHRRYRLGTIVIKAADE
jgi:hypothetical protein